MYDSADDNCFLPPAIQTERAISVEKGENMGVGEKKEKIFDFLLTIGHL